MEREMRLICEIFIWCSSKIYFFGSFTAFMVNWMLSRERSEELEIWISFAIVGVVDGIGWDFFRFNFLLLHAMELNWKSRKSKANDFWQVSYCVSSKNDSYTHLTSWVARLGVKFAKFSRSGFAIVLVLSTHNAATMHQIETMCTCRLPVTSHRSEHFATENKFNYLSKISQISFRRRC